MENWKTGTFFSLARHVDDKFIVISSLARWEIAKSVDI